MNWIIVGSTYENPNTTLFLICEKRKKNESQRSESDEDAITYPSSEAAENIINREKFKYLSPRVITDIESANLSSENFTKRQEWLDQSYCPPR